MCVSRSAPTVESGECHLSPAKASDGFSIVRHRNASTSSDQRSGAFVTAITTSESASGVSARPTSPLPTTIRRRVTAPTAATAPSRRGSRRFAPVSCARSRVALSVGTDALLPARSREPQFDDAATGTEQVLELPGLEQRPATEISGGGGEERQRQACQEGRDHH